MSLLSTELVDEFLASRKSYIGGSDIAAVMGKSRWRTPLMVYQDKTEDRPPRPVNKAMQRGVGLEPNAASAFMEAIPCSMALSPVSGLKSTKYPHCGGHPDRIIHLPDGRRGILEIKCPDRFVFQKVRDEGADIEYELQTQWYMGLTDADIGYLMYFNADLWDWEIFEIQPDLAQQEEMYTAAEEFWSKYVYWRKPPEEVQLPEYGDKAKTTGDLDGEMLELVQQYADLSAIIDNAEATQKEVRTKLLGMTVTPGTWQGHGFRYTMAMNPGKKTISKSKLEEAGIDPTPYMTEGKPYSTITVKPVKEEL